MYIGANLVKQTTRGLHVHVFVNSGYPILQACIHFYSIVLDSVASEDWYKKIESFIDSTDIISEAQGPSKVRPFITFVQDARSKELVKLTFDKSMYARERRADVSDVL